jgi:hypothetical protein
MAGAGVKTFTNSTLTAAEMNTYLMQQSVMTFASAAARTSAFSAASITPSAGMMSYLVDVGQMQVYDGASWFAKSRPGEIIECLTGACDGSSVVVSSGTYTLQNVTAAQDPGNTSVDITGSTLSYTPPVGATKVVYEFSFTRYFQTAGHAIMHFRFFVDGTEVTKARFDHSGSQYPEGLIHFMWTMPIGGSADTSIGRQASWATAKTLKMQARDYSTGVNDGALHGTNYWDGSGGTQLHVPNIRITAIA